MITLYSQPGCGPCMGVERTLNRAQVPYTVKDISTDTEAREFIAGLGYTGTPVIYGGPDDHWQGNRPDQLKTLIATLKEVAA